jgi:hypothetical protein
MAKTDPWLRLYTETIDDEKLDAAAEMAGCEYDTTFTAWSTMMIYAKRSPIEGVLLIARDVPMTCAQIAKKMRRAKDHELVKRIIDAFIALDMVTVTDCAYVITHWRERQYKSDNPTERWRSWRDKQDNPTIPPSSPTLPPQPQSQTIAPPPNPPQPELRIIHEVTGLYPDFMHEADVIRNVQVVHNKHRLAYPDELRDYLTEAYKAWCATKTTEGKPYNPSNWHWLDWAVTGFRASAKKPDTDGLTDIQMEQAAGLLGLKV